MEVIKIMYSLIPHPSVLHIWKEVPYQLWDCADMIHIQFYKEFLFSIIQMYYKRLSAFNTDFYEF
jgi:hypothetical protein